MVQYAVPFLHIVKNLVNVGADLSMQDDLGNTVLHTTVEAPFCNSELVHYLLSSGAPLHARDRSGAQAIHSAARIGHAQCTRDLLDGGAHMSSSDAQGATPMDVATRHGHAAVLDVLRAVRRTR